MEDIVLKVGDTEGILNAIIAAVSHSINDRNANVIHRTFQLLQTICEINHNVSFDGNGCGVVTNAINFIMPSLAEKLGDNL